MFRKPSGDKIFVEAQQEVPSISATVPRARFIIFPCFQKIGDNFIPRYKYELAKHSSDVEDVVAWLIIWSFPVGVLVGMLRNGGELDTSHVAFDDVHAAGVLFEVLG